MKSLSPLCTLRLAAALKSSISQLTARTAGGASTLALLLTPVIFCTFSQAAEEPDPSLKLREQLRAVTLQLRTAQTDSANALAAAATSDQAAKDLTTKLQDLEKRNATLLKQANNDKASAAGSIEVLEKKVVDRDAFLVQYKQAFERAKAAYQKADSIATTKEGERAQLAATLITAKHTTADRERKNIALFNTANEILDRYQNYALGKALSAREPFIGTTRVKIENLVQGYQDKILDNRIAAKKP